MKVNELRIGNWVESKNQGSNYIANKLPEKTKFKYLVGGMWQGPINLSAIKLTVDWLTNFGLRRKLFNGLGSYGYTYDAQLDGFIVSYEKSEDYFAVNYNGIPQGRVEYVHQLQNLYHALTGEELTIKS